MGSIWLTDLPSKLSGIPNVNVYSGWQTRSRGSGGYDALLGIAVHHTASKTSTQNDCYYNWVICDDGPVGAIYLGRAGEIVIGAAGATNCVGKGGPWNLSRGTVPQDKGNQNTISIEAGNSGTGEPWPDAQQNAYIALVKALCDGYGFAATDVISHYEWCLPSCPGRKIDPAGPSRWGSINASGTWNMDLFRAELTGSTPTPEPVPPDTGGGDRGWVCPPYPGTGDYGCSYDTCRGWQDAMILNGIISDNSANHDGVWGNGMHNACFNMQKSWGWGDADGVGGSHTWPHLRSRGLAPCPKCGK